MSNIDKQALRERYSPKPAPECHICGKEMTIQRMSASRITYAALARPTTIKVATTQKTAVSQMTIMNSLASLSSM